ncbi:MAG TPA: hypothetical protein VNQ77_01015 [Frankiaceae bacterium]|nr:hypothetical protein [Frankiaceae bacterium]
MRITRIALATVALAGAFAVPATASEPPVGICSYNIDWGVVGDLPEPARSTAFFVICKI